MSTPDWGTRLGGCGGGELVGGPARLVNPSSSLVQGDPELLPADILNLDRLTYHLKQEGGGLIFSS